MTAIHERVPPENISRVVAILQGEKLLALDTETTGLRPYHGDKPFGICIAMGGREETWAQAFYFDLKEDFLPSELEWISDLAPEAWFMHNAKFDLHQLAGIGIHPKGKVYCTMAQARVEYNDQWTLTLDSQLKRIGLAKDDKVKEWLDENKCFTNIQVPHYADKEVKNYHYDRVPDELLIPYACQDTLGTFALGEHQRKEISEKELGRVSENEAKLTTTLFQMERVGVQADLPFCERALAHARGKLDDLVKRFELATGKDYIPSGKLFSEVFASEKARWVYGPPTEKKGEVNPTFSSKVLESFTHPAAKILLELRDAKSRHDFFAGFLYQADPQGVIHPTFFQSGTIHGRMSSADPNMQNMTSEEDGSPEEFAVRRAIIPRPGRMLVSIDWDTMEYKFMLEVACGLLSQMNPSDVRRVAWKLRLPEGSFEHLFHLQGPTPLVERILSGVDYHQATVDLSREKTGKSITRKQAKTSNFLELYGGGAQKLAKGLGITVDEAYAIKKSLREAAPEISITQSVMMETATTRGWVKNWMGRRCYFPKSSLSYRAPNYLIAGGCADIVKKAMNEIQEFLMGGGWKSQMILNVHDELVFDVVKEEATELVPMLKKTMENAYQGKFLPMTCSVSFSEKSLADLEEWPE